YHTGIKIGANSSYNGTRFYNDSNMATQLMAVGDGNNNVLVNYDLTVGGASTASNFYNNGWYRNNQQGEGMYNQANGVHWYSDADGRMSLMDTTGGKVEIRFAPNNVTRGYVYADSGQIGFLDNNHTWNLMVRHTNGSKYASYDGDANWDFYSDRRIKTNIVSEPDILTRIMKSKVVNYDFKDMSNKKTMVGFIAQDIEVLFPELVSEHWDEELGFDVKMLGYSTFGVLAMGGVKELKIEKDAEIKALKAKIDDLKKEKDEDRDALKNEVMALKKQIETLMELVNKLTRK
ncbi:MAG: hypothetical protein ACI9BD_000325, partial [Candidatus Marinamargulisbacteria bacterium]